MSAPQNTPPPAGEPPAGGGDPTRVPTFAEIQQIAQAASEAVAQATTAAEAATRAAEGVTSKAGELGLQIPKEVVDQIAGQAAGAVIAQLRELGALRDETPPPAGEGTPPAPPAGEGTPPTPPAGDPPPAKGKTFAERWLGS
jgi:hypothetical protein